MFVALDEKLNPICAVTEDGAGKRKGEAIVFSSKSQALTWIKEHHELIKDARYSIVSLSTYLESVKQRRVAKNV